MGEIRQEIVEALERGAVLVTANERSARSLRLAYDDFKIAAGRERWKPPALLSWSAWTSSLWRTLLLEGKVHDLLLNSFQEHAVWRRIISEDDDHTSLTNVDGLARLAAQSWSRLRAYLPASKGDTKSRTISSLLTERSTSVDTAALARWARTFEERCRAERLISAAEVEGLLERALRRGDLDFAHREVLLLGFDGVTPSQQSFLAGLTNSGVSVTPLEQDLSASQVVLTYAVDEIAEIRACARWAVEQLRASPQSHIAVIVPDLTSDRAALARVFREILAPEMESIAADETEAPYEFSLGPKLFEVPMIVVALHVLRWVRGSLPLRTISSLLTSDYFASTDHDDETKARAEFDAWELRRLDGLRPELGLGGLASRIATSERQARLAGTLNVVRTLERLAEELRDRSQTFDQWSRDVRRFLSAARWAPSRGESSEEFQVRERWESALDALSTLDFEGRSVTYTEALEALEHITAQTIFAPQSRSAPVQIMGPLEAAGSSFDAMWLLRCGEQTWPPLPISSPLVSWALQRELGMPGSDAARDQQAAIELTRRLLRSATRVVVSYALRTDQGSQKASSLFRQIDGDELPLAEIVGGEAPRAVLAMEYVVDPSELPSYPARAVTGGVRALELQAACGFRAFAELRLWSSTLEARDLGMNAKENGIAVHKILESFWHEVRSHSRLLAMNATERDAALSRAIQVGLDRAERLAQGTWETAYVSMQHERLRRLLRGWLRREQQRPAFEVLESERALQDMPLGPLRFNLRIDRIDLVDEMRVLIDYKTGATKPAAWLSDRPDQPQIPLYAILSAQTEGDEAHEGQRSALGAVAFASVRAGKEARLQGFGARADLLPDRMASMETETFETQMDHWQRVLERLAHDFAFGNAEVKPKSYPSTCRRCDQRTLCRLDPSLLEDLDDDPEEDRDG